MVRIRLDDDSDIAKARTMAIQVLQGDRRMDEEDKEMVMCSTAEWSAQDSGSDLGQGQDQAKPGGIKIWPRSSPPSHIQ